ncbi:hypothetical protein [Paenibacillus flagellatus]|uniref:Uncharacterized protein n=1 Tax=Paenibacillus flagellatus TaxID=2211139 RepID=A0A2V5K7X9_9BACL|nr:hypothetical protein [Paenibacillus flagellatus]PYI53943.1 hypothetical protein DLM86_15425 [Paenibacillus flagellatus]
MKDERRNERPVVVWENTADTSRSGQAERAAGGGQVVPLRFPGTESAGEATVVTRTMPGREGSAGDAAVVTYVGSGFWAGTDKARASAEARMAA